MSGSAKHGARRSSNLSPSARIESLAASGLSMNAIQDRTGLPIQLIGKVIREFQLTPTPASMPEEHLFHIERVLAARPNGFPWKEARK